MKKFFICLMATCMSLVFLPLKSNAAENTAPSSMATSKTSEAEAFLVRLNEINAMDKSNLKSTEKKILRKEVRSIKHMLSTMDGGVYLSVGAIIIILLLLILLL